MDKREDFEAWTRRFYSDLACASDTWSDEKGTYADFAHHMAWHLWRDMQSRLESLEKEMQEQCRIIGMSAERELSLIAKIKSLEKDAARFKKLAAHMTFALDGEFVTMDFSCPVDATKTHDIHEDWIEPNFTDSVRNTVDTAMQANKGE